MSVYKDPLSDCTNKESLPKELSLAALHNMVQRQGRKDFFSFFSGMVIKNLNVINATKGNVFVNVSADDSANRHLNKKIRYTATVKVDNKVLVKSQYPGDYIKTGDKIDVTIGSLNVYRNFNLAIEAYKVMPAGVSEYELLKQKNRKKCKELGYYNIPKKFYPSVVRKAAIITSTHGSIEKDILDNIGLKRANISKFTFTPDDAGNLAAVVNRVSSTHDYDVIILFRGGREDARMSIYSEMVILTEISKADTMIITAIGHAADKTLADELSDISFDTPTDAAISVRNHNKDCLITLLRNYELSNDSSLYYIKNCQRIISDTQSNIFKNSIIILKNIQQEIKKLTSVIKESNFFQVLKRDYKIKVGTLLSLWVGVNNSTNSILQYQKNSTTAIYKTANRRSVDTLRTCGHELLQLNNTIGSSFLTIEKNHKQAQQLQKEKKKNQILLVVLIIIAFLFILYFIR